MTWPAGDPILHTVARFSWLPAIVRARPSEVYEFRYRALTSDAPEHASIVIPQALRASGAHLLRESPPTWEVSLPWRTLVYGIIRRDVEETVAITLVSGPESWELLVRCEPLQTHTAHAAGAGGVLLLATAVWLVTGWTVGLVPGFTTAVAGGLWADVARVMALDVFERRLRRLTEDLGSALWPGVPAQVLPPPPRFGHQ